MPGGPLTQRWDAQSLAALDERGLARHLCTAFQVATHASAVLLVAHWLACGYFVVSYAEGFASEAGAWVPPVHVDGLGAPQFTIAFAAALVSSRYSPLPPHTHFVTPTPFGHSPRCSVSFCHIHTHTWTPNTSRNMTKPRPNPLCPARSCAIIPMTSHSRCLHSFKY